MKAILKMMSLMEKVHFKMKDLCILAISKMEIMMEKGN